MILFYFLPSPGKKGVRVTLRFHCASIYALAMTVKNFFFPLPFLRAVMGNRPTPFFSCAEFSSNPLWLLNPENFEIGIRNSMGGGGCSFTLVLNSGMWNARPPPPPLSPHSVVRIVSLPLPPLLRLLLFQRVKNFQNPQNIKITIAKAIIYTANENQIKVRPLKL